MMVPNQELKPGGNEIRDHYRLGGIKVLHDTVIREGLPFTEDWEMWTRAYREFLKSGGIRLGEISFHLC